ncbi:hypothetical protein WJX72_001907 [[Myrmecia] bisecta]|uniref:Major facilitator superfamily (MFS) profile domain-containing protein n=1 Tax=[Myrmecia] bisecta TaxID=41462 RepID=A0AAW1PXV4_9CHLO
MAENLSWEDLQHADAATAKLRAAAMGLKFSKRQILAVEKAERPAWRQLLGSRDFRIICMINAVLFMTATGSRSVLMPLLAYDVYGYTPQHLGMLFGGMAVLNLVGTAPAAVAADRFGRKWTIVPAGLGLGAALGLMAAGASPELFAAGAAVFAISNAFVGPSPAAYAADVMPAHQRGLGLGLYRSAGDIGLLVGPLVLGVVADVSSVQLALHANAAAITVAVLYFGARACETKHLRRHKAKAR